MAPQELEPVSALVPIRSVLVRLKQIDVLQLPPIAQRAMEQRLSADASDLMERMIPHNPGHGRRTAHYCALLGKVLMVSDEAVHDLHLAGPSISSSLGVRTPGILPTMPECKATLA